MRRLAVPMVLLVIAGAAIGYVGWLRLEDPLGWRFGNGDGRVHSWHDDDGTVVALFTPSATDQTVIDCVNWLHANAVTASTVRIIGAPVTDRAIEAVASLEGVRVLDLQQCRLTTNQGLAHIGRMTSLRHLRLDGTGLSKGGLQPLLALKGLDTLDVSETHVGDDDVKPALALPALRVLLTHDTRVSKDLDAQIEVTLVARENQARRAGAR
jgi:hypothetical protein